MSLVISAILHSRVFSQIDFLKYLPFCQQIIDFRRFDSNFVGLDLHFTYILNWKAESANFFAFRMFGKGPVWKYVGRIFLAWLPSLEKLVGPIDFQMAVDWEVFSRWFQSNFVNGGVGLYLNVFSLVPA